MVRDELCQAQVQFCYPGLLTQFVFLQVCEVVPLVALSSCDIVFLSGHHSGFGLSVEKMITILSHGLSLVIATFQISISVSVSFFETFQITVSGLVLSLRNFNLRVSLDSVTLKIVVLMLNDVHKKKELLIFDIM